MADFVSFGEVLMRLSSPVDSVLSKANNLEVFYGGSEANIASALSQWRISCAHVTFLPEHELGDAALSYLRSFHVNTEYVFRNLGRMPIYFLDPGHGLRSPKVIYDRFHSAFSLLDPKTIPWREIFKGASWFHWSGITPAISESAAIACKMAIETARDLNLTISADVNYRRVLWQYGKTPQEIMPELIANCDVLVGGIDDFRNCLGIIEDSDQPFSKVCKAIKEKYPQVKKIANTLRSTVNTNLQELQGMLWTEDVLLQSKLHSLNPVLDRIGSGDAFMAGMIYQWMHKKDDQHALDFGTAAAAYKHSIHGDVLIASIEEINTLINNTNVGKLLR